MLNPEQGRTSASKPFLRRAKRCKLRLDITQARSTLEAGILDAKP